MDRKQRRLFIRQAKKKGISTDAINAYIQMQKEDKIDIDFENGEKCKLKVGEILTAHPEDGKNKNYIEFVKSCRDRIVTIEYDREHLTPPVRVVCIREDTNEIKHLFPTVYLEKASE